MNGFIYDRVLKSQTVTCLWRTYDIPVGFKVLLETEKMEGNFFIFYELVGEVK